MNKLTDKQEKFCQEYLIDLNGTQAAIRAGYSKDTANRIASENLSKPDIQQRVAELQKAIQKRTELTQDKVLKDIEEIKQRCMQAKPVMYFDKVDKEYKQETAMVEHEDGTRTKEGVWTFDANPALKACELQAKHLGLLKERIVSENINTNINSKPVDVSAVGAEIVSLMKQLREKKEREE